MCQDMVNSCQKTVWMQITCDFGPRAAVEYPYVSVEVGHCVICVKAESGSRGGNTLVACLRRLAKGSPLLVSQWPHLLASSPPTESDLVRDSFTACGVASD